MNNLFISQPLSIKYYDKKNVLPNADNVPVGPTEKLVREEIRKLNENAEQLKKLKEQIDRKNITEK